MTLDVRLIADGGLANETDPNSHLSVTSTNQVNYTGLINTEQAWTSIDYGADYFSGRAVVDFKFNIASSVNPAGNTAHVLIGFSQLNTYGKNTANYEVALQIVVVDTTPTVVNFNNYYRRTTAETITTASGTGAKATDYYGRVSLLSSLGQYGAILIQVFSDAALTTLLTWQIKVRTAADNYRYLMLAQGNYTTGTASITGANSDFTLTAPAAGIDLTTGVETDTGTGRLVVYADCIVATALNIANSETAKHVAIDEGADFFGDYTVSGVLNITAFASGAVGQMFEILAVTDAAADAGVANDLQGISIYWATSTTYKPYIHQAISGADTFSTVGPTLNINQPYSFTLNRSGTTLTMKVWNDLVLTDFAGTSQVGSDVTWTGRAATPYRYLMPVASYLNGATSRSSTFTLGGVKRQGNPAAAALGQATETDTAQVIALSENATRDVAQASETNTAQAITTVFGALTIAVNQTTETDLARPVTALQGVTLAIGQVTESDLAQSIAVYAATTIVIGQAIELDVAQVILEAYSNQTLNVGQVTETDAAQVISSPTPIAIALAQASEIDLALAVTVYATRTIALGQASETDIARAITVVFGVTETWSINLEHPTTGLALTGLGNSVVKFEAYQESTAEWFNPATGALQSAQPTPLALLEDISGNHNGRYAAATTIGAFNTWMVLHVYWDYDAGDGRGTVRRHTWSRAYYNSGVELVAGVTAQDKLDIASAVWEKTLPL